MAREKAKPIRDTVTGQEYRSMSDAGRDLYQLVGGKIEDHFVWYAILKKFPTRFQTKNPSGLWVGLDDPSLMKD
jgi:Arc/MetJ-type ribon-helix-helix transcriptional regulator